MDNPQNVAVVLGALFTVSEALSLIPSIKANGVFQLVYRIIRGLSGKKG
jgi:hypothetical protein